MAATGRVGIPLTLTEALHSPCIDCTTSPCCNLLKLQSIEFETILDVDLAMYLVNFEGLVIQMDRSGRRGHVYLRQACRHLEKSTGFCRVHRTPAQPSICVHYNEYNCSYRQHLMEKTDVDVPLVDQARMAWFASHLTFGDDGRIIRFPDPDEMISAIASLGLDETAASPDRKEPRRLIATLGDSCDGCQAWCCKALVFERPVPVDASKLDEFRYSLGFPGVELGVTDESWWLIVHTTCRHLQANRCSIFGLDSRPLVCRDIEAAGCQYRSRLGNPDPEGFATFTLETFPALADSILFDDLGGVDSIPPIDAIQHI